MKRPKSPQRRRGIRRQRYARTAGACQHYVNGNIVFVVKDGSILTVIPREWLL